MAPETANQKRKRGRPSNALRDNGDASGSQLRHTRRDHLSTAPQNNREPDMDESSRPRKRGRRANTEAASQAQPEPSPETSRPQRSKGKRGRPEPERTNDEGEEAEVHTNSNATSENTHPKKRGRPPKATEAVEENEPEADEADDENEENSSFLRRSGRIRRSPRSTNQGPQEATKPVNEQGSKDQKPKGRKKKGRPSLEKQATDEPEQDPVPQPKKKRGRPSLNSQPPADEEAVPEPQAQQKKRRRPAPSGDTAASPTGERESVQEEHRPRKGRRRRSNESQSEQRSHRRSPGTQSRSSSPDSDGSPPRYRHLTTRTRRIPRNVIESKWTPLEPPALSSVTSLLQSASRPVLLRLSTNTNTNTNRTRNNSKTQQRHAQAAVALSTVGNRLRNKIARGLPFPPATTSARREDEFEFERAVAGVQALESQLDPLLHGVELLRREKERAERDLEREYKVLARLGTNAHAEARQRREQLRKMHVLVPEKRGPGKARTDGVESKVGEMVPMEEGSGRVFANLKDEEELSGLASQISSHMESMRGNLQQIDGVVPAIARSQGLLRAALQARLDREQLESVILG